MKFFLHKVLYLLDRDKTKLPFMIMIFFLSSSLDLIGIGLIGPYIALLANLDTYSGIYQKIISSLHLNQNNDQLLLFTGYFLLLIFIFKTIISIWINKILVQFSAKQHIRLVAYLMSSYQSLPYSNYLDRNSTEYVYSIHHLSSQYANHIVSPLLRMISDGIIVIVITILLFFQNPAAFILLMSLLLIMILFYDTFFRKKMNYYGEQCNLASEAILKTVSESMEGLKELRILGKEKYFYNTVIKDSKKLSFYSIKSTIVQISLRYILELTMIVFVVSLVLGSLLFGENVKLILPTLSVFGVASLRLFPSINTFMQGLTQMRLGKDSVSKLYKDVRSIREPNKVRLDNSQVDNNQNFSNDEEFEKLTLTDVSFSYPNSKYNALENISLEIKSGESIGIIGTSGSGKTTLLDTLLGLLPPQNGYIQFNGTNIDKDLRKWRSQIAYIPQEVFLTDDTLKNNVALGIDNKDINNDRVIESLRQARLSELVKKLPNGVETILGERGIRFSGGQRQRVALARAFYHERNILILDEATSALDNETEKEIVNELKQLKGKKTMFVIAHRLTTLQHCHRIYELQNGKIKNVGTYNQILSLIENT